MTDDKGLKSMASSNPSLKVAIVGSGPSGFYAVEALLASDASVEADIFEKLPVPFGLVRYGVAPDHQKLKEVTKIFTRIALDPRVRVFGNVNVGVDLSIDELLASYDAVVVACGASVDRKMGIPGEHLPGSYSAVDFVGWYNGHPDYQHHVFDFSNEHAVIVGQGNVAIDVCRILAKDVVELRRTDITDRALQSLAGSRVRTITIAGRRGPAQMKFTTKELRELGALSGWDVVVDPLDLQLDALSVAELASPQAFVANKNVEFLKGCACKPRTSEREIRFQFYRAPRRIDGHEAVQGITMERTRLDGPAFDRRAVGTGDLHALPAGMVFRSIGYEAAPFQGLPFDTAAKVIPNEAGRVCGLDGARRPRVYVTGWIKRGPTGIIGTNRVDSIETIASLLADHDPSRVSGRDGAEALLRQRGIHVMTFAHWQAIDQIELSRGQAQERVRTKITSAHEFVSSAHAAMSAVVASKETEHRELVWTG